MKTVLLAILLAGCSFGALKPGKSSITSERTTFQQSENPKTESTQTYEETVTRLPAEQTVVSRNLSFPTITTKKVVTSIGPSQKDTAREIGAKLSSLKGVVWVGVLLFIFGAASAFYPPLKMIVGSVTTSAVACAAGLALIVLPSLIVGNELLILGVAGGAVGLYFFSHRHASVHSELKTLKGEKK